MYSVGTGIQFGDLALENVFTLRRKSWGRLISLFCFTSFNQFFNATEPFSALTFAPQHLKPLVTVKNGCDID
jgi:hypothetical protein